MLNQFVKDAILTDAEWAQILQVNLNTTADQDAAEEEERKKRKEACM